MLAQKVLLSGIGIIGLVGTVAAFNTNIFTGSDTSAKHKNIKHLLVKVKNSEQKINIPVSGLTSRKEANYICKVGQNIIQHCKIYKLNNISVTAKNVLLSDASDIVDNKEFVIGYAAASSDKIESDSTISITSKDGNKNYFELSVFPDNFQDQKTKGYQSQTIIAQVKNIFSNENDVLPSDSYKCKLTAFQNCDIFKLPDSFNLEKSNIAISSNNLSIEKKVTNKSDLSKDKYVLINIKTPNIFAHDWEGGEKNIYLSDSKSEFIKVELIASVVGDNSSIRNFDDQNLEYQYLVVSASNPTTSKSDKSDFYDSSNDRNNYKCLIPTTTDQNIEDDTCQIYKLNSLSPENQTSVDLYKIFINAANEKMTSSPVNSKNYVLKISKNKLSQMSSASGKTISVVSKKAPNEKYIEFTKLHNLNKDDSGFKTNLILAKIIQKGTSASFSPETTNFKCTFKSDNEQKTDCKVLSVSSSSSSNPPLTLAKLNGTSPNSGEVNNFVLIEIAGDNSLKTERELRSFAPKIFASAGSPTEALLTTEYVDSYVGTIDTTTPTSSKVMKVEKSPQDYLVVVHSLNASDQSSDELSSGNIKNYKCKTTISSSTFIDDNCFLVEITGNNSNSINLSNVLSSNTLVTQKSNLTKDKYFKLVINNPEFMSQNFTETQDIKITSNKTTGANLNKDFGNLRVVSKFVHNRNVGQTDWFLVKSNKNIDSSITLSGFKCKYTDEQTHTTCNFYKTTSTLSDSSNKQWDLSNFTKTVNKDDLAQGKFLIVKLTTAKKSITDISNKTISISKQDDNNEITTLNVMSPLHVNLNEEAIQGKPVVLS